MLLTSAPITSIKADDSIPTSETNTSESITNEENSESIDTSSAENNLADSETSEDTSTSTETPTSEESLASSSDSLSSNNVESSEDPTPNDNWELGLIFYDSTVDDGKTPLTSIDWDATDDGYEEGITRVITVQINYKNTNAVTTYQPGELEIKVPNLIYNTSSKFKDGPWWKSNVIVGANDSSHTNYEWNFITAEAPDDTQEYFTFSNSKTIEEKANFEGSIQIAYTITPLRENWFIDETDSSIECFEDECIHSLNKNIQAVLNETTSTENLNFQYNRIYKHPWKKENNTLDKTAKIITKDIDAAKVLSLSDTPDDYYWVKFYLIIGNFKKLDYPNIGQKSYKIEEYLPENVIVGNHNGKAVNYDSEKGYYLLEFPYEDIEYCDYDYATESARYGYPIFVGYPKSEYNDSNNNLKITNYAKLYSEFNDNLEVFDYQDDATISINLSKYIFTYSGNLYSIKKYFQGNPTYEKMVGLDPELPETDINVNLNPYALYIGKPMDIKFGDDLLYISDNDGTNRKLQEDEYYYRYVHFPIMKDIEGKDIEDGKYDVELWVKYRGDNEYTLYSTFKNTRKGFNFYGSKYVTGYYYVIKGVTESIKADDPREAYQYRAILNINSAKNIPQTGEIYNFCFMDIIIDGIIKNTPGLDSYANLLTKEDIATYDLETYGKYKQRDSKKINYSNYKLRNIDYQYKSEKKFSEVKQDSENEKFAGKSTLTIYQRGQDGIYNQHEIATYFKDEDFVKGFEIYDLLPEGMELSSTKKQILDSLSFSIYGNNADNIKVYNEQGTRIEWNEFKNIIKENASVEIINNYNNTNRTKIFILIDFHKTPLCIQTFDGYSESNAWDMSFSYNWEINYDSYVELGNNYTNVFFWKFYKNNIPHNFGWIRGISGENMDLDMIDVDGDGNDDFIYDDGYYDAITYYSEYDKLTLSSVISTHQDVTKYVQTDKSNFSTGTVKVSPDGEYTYKLRVRTGQNNVTNLVIYDNIESYLKIKEDFIPSYGNNEYWQGELLGIDTSYAESKGYHIKTYYSESETANNLASDSSWKEYTDDIDKSKIKSLAFEYLDDTGNPATLSPNESTYILIKMKAPNFNTNLLAYNGYWTQWNAIDEFGQTVHDITGINSNITKVMVEQRFNLEVKKEWDDKNHSEYRPSDITVILKKDNRTIEQKTLSEQNNWTTIFYNLIEDEKDSYNIEEIAVPFYTTEIQIDENIVTIKNTLNILTTIEGQKSWIGDNQDSRPSEININLIRKNIDDSNWKIIETKTVTANDDWKYLFENVPTKDINGEDYIYAIQEVPIDGYKAYYNSPKNGLAIKFNDQFKFEGTTDYIEIYYKNQENNIYKLGKYGSTSLAGKTVNIPSHDFYVYFHSDSSVVYYGFKVESIEPIEIDESSVSKTKVTSLPNYGITELTGNNYPETEHNYKNSQNILWHYTGNIASTKSEEPQENFFNIINEKLFDMHVEKIWDDDENINRPENITIIFKKKNEEIERRQLNASNNWKTTFSNLLAGEKSDYKVEEVALEGYDAPEITYNESTNTYEITNRINRFFDLEVSKVWEDDNNERNLRPENITVILKKAGKEVERKTISNTDNWKITFENLDANKRQQYTVEEVSNIYYNNKVELDVEQGTCVITNTLKELYSMTVKKIWNDFNNEVGLRPTSVTFILKRSGTEIERKVANKDNNWTVTFDNLIKQYQSNYIVTETSVPNYTGSSTRYNSSTGMYEITNTLKNDIYRIIKGTKTWEEDFEGERPSSIEINLYRNGVFYKRTTTSKSKNWEYEFRVPINDSNGNAYTYEIKEAVPSGYEAEYSTVYDGYYLMLDENNLNVYENDSLYIYYEYEGKIYRQAILYTENGYYYTNDVYIPLNNYYIMWNRNSTNSTIRVKIKKASITENMLTAELTSYTHQDILNTNFKECSSSDKGSYNRNDSVVKQHWTETLDPNVVNFNIKNTSLAWTLSGTKTWKDDNLSDRPESITIDLLYDGEVISTTTTNASKDWEYSFRVYDDSYHYSVKERPVVGYETSYSGFNITNTKIKTLNLSFIKEVEGLEESFNRLNLNKNDSHKFQLTLENTETKDIISVLINDKNTINVKNIPIGTYIIKEKDDTYFDFVNMESLNSVEGVTFEKSNEGIYLLTVTKDISKNTPTLQIKVNNKLEPERFYEDKTDKEKLYNFKN